jgi:hypothetical protein
MILQWQYDLPLFNIYHNNYTTLFYSKARNVWSSAHALASLVGSALTVLKVIFRGYKNSKQSLAQKLKH